MTNIEVEINDNYICVYERLNDDCIRLLHMYGKNPVCVVPDMLDGMRVTELAEYCFSFKSMPEKLKTELGIDDILRPDMTELCDDYIERVILPDGMQKIGRLCFYNCSRLSVLELPSDICDVDGDAFMNCTKLYMLVMRGSPKDKSCLKQILSQISTLVRVRWADSDGNAVAQACFFEYDQSYDEIGPAHIFTPWTGLYKSYDSVTDCYGQQPDFVELGLSSDSDLADTIKELADYTFLTNSDSHSPWPHRIGREFNRMELKDLSFKSLCFSIKNNDIIENYGFDPRMGKYHETGCIDCHRIYNIHDAVECDMKCSCGGRIKKGVKGRIQELASFDKPHHPSHRPHRPSHPLYYLLLSY